MNFELMHVLTHLEERTPRFFKVEALTEGDETGVKENAIRILSSKGDPKAVTLLKDILRII